MRDESTELANLHIVTDDDNVVDGVGVYNESIKFDGWQHCLLVQSQNVYQ